MGEWLTTKSNDIRRPTAHDSDFVIGFISHKNPHVKDRGSVSNTEDWRRYFRPNAQPDIGVRTDNAIATRTQKNEGPEPQGKTHEKHFAEKPCRPEASAI